MHRSTRPLALVLLAIVVAGRPLSTEQGPAPELLPLSSALLSKLPPDWRELATHIKATDAEQQRFLKLSDVVFRQTVARLLTRIRPADAFVRTQIAADPSPAVRTALVQAIAADARWSALPETALLIEGVVARDPDPAVSLTALEVLRRRRMRELNALLDARLSAAVRDGADTAAIARLTEAQERWFALERGTMLPAFLRTPPPVFSVKPADAPVRVLAFGDFGNGSAGTEGGRVDDRRLPCQPALRSGRHARRQLLQRRHGEPSDPRWRTWFEELYAPLGITFFPALGNHDWGHPDSPAAEVLYSGKTPTWRMPAAYYTFTAGPVQFFAIDTQSVAIARQQRDWLDREIGKSQAKWKVVYGHHPIYSDGNYEDRPDLIETLLPILANRVDVCLAGHDHNLQALAPERGVRFYVAGGGGAGLYDVHPGPRSLFASRSNGFAVIDADADRLSVKLVDNGGAVVYEHVLTKRADGKPE